MGTPWFVYLIRTRQGQLYCGVTTDVSRRLIQHRQGKGARALRGKGPLSLAWQSQPMEKRTAMQREWQIKQWPKQRKEALCARFCCVRDNGVD
ncbi:GIY-YIG nuclease family protein [Salinivibrio kushneri]|uniref:GIY-YIG nuclease family protein n=1 Tax=Salinivibrio kushneri TaxID=1908198 RepID=A0AA47KNJ9_9GAMM|nr:GIY-YIG nuclease family protein [Salinivibrio kushneri]WBA10236.1 GIY-YIG nuclease family protein [Salinivibrio kushneri]